LKKLSKIITNKAVKYSALAVIMTALTLGIFLSPFTPSNQPQIQAEASTSISLFNATGRMTRSQAQNIMTALGSAPEDITTVDRAMPFRLFPDITFTSNHASSLTRLNWRIVHIDGDRLTFLAAAPYRNSPFSTTGGLCYLVSDLRANLITDFNYLNTRLGGLSDYILPLGAVPTNHNHEAARVNENDRIWIPSRYEFITRWRLTSHGLATFDNGSFNARSWLRNQSTTGAVSISTMSSAGALGTIIGSYRVYSVRPALHISLQSIIDAANDGASGGTVASPDQNGNGSSNNNNNDYANDNLAWILFFGLIGGIVVIILLFGIIAKILNKGGEIEQNETTKN